MLWWKSFFENGKPLDKCSQQALFDIRASPDGSKLFFFYALGVKFRKILDLVLSEISKKDTLKIDERKIYMGPMSEVLGSSLSYFM